MGSVLQDKRKDSAINEPKIIEEGPFSTVYKAWTAVGDQPTQWVAIKSASIHRHCSKEPHDIIKEVRLLCSISHENIISIYKHQRSDGYMKFWMPYIPYSLPTLLASPYFSPHSSPFTSSRSVDELRHLAEKFAILAKSLIFQMCAAVSYLHSQTIAHRDIKPGNVLFTNEGCVKLIDFGISWKKSEDDSMKEGDLWPEQSSRMYFEVSTGPYRAPELLFGTRTYDAFAIDTWSLGATISEFFTSLRLSSEDEDEDEDEDEPLHKDVTQSFILPNSTWIINPRVRWSRDSLFNANRGEIGLAWSIFKIRGTPNEQTWPGFSDLPDSKSVTFIETPAVPLATLLPHIPSCQGSEEQDLLLSLLNGFLEYPPSQRLHPVDALSNQWFHSTSPLVLPSGYSPEPAERVTYEWEGKSLGEWLHSALRV